MFEGVATVRSGEVVRGLALCDEAILSVHAGDVVPTWPGNLYGQVMGLCFELRCRYEAARTQVRFARALDGFGDREGAARERAHAGATFEDLGARPDPEALGRAAASRPVPGGLTGREVEVLVLVAEGASNAAIADRLTISGRTVERHVSNIFLKLDVSSRTQAARVAFEHGLVGGTT